MAEVADKMGLLFSLIIIILQFGHTYTLDLKSVPVVPITQKMREAMFEQWYQDALGGVMIALTNKKFLGADPRAQANLAECTSGAEKIGQYLKCMKELFGQMAENNPEYWDGNSRTVGAFVQQIPPSRHTRGTDFHGDPGPGAYAHPGIGALWGVRDLIQGLTNSAPQNSPVLENPQQDVPSQPQPQDLQKSRGGVRLEKIPGLMEAINRRVGRKYEAEQQVKDWLVQFSGDIKKLAGGSNLTASLLSPTFFSDNPDLKKGFQNVLSPDILSQFEGPNSVLPWKEITKGMTPEEDLYWRGQVKNLLTMIAGDRSKVDKDMAQKLKESIKEKKLVTKSDMTNYYGRQSKKAFDAFADLQNSLTPEQWENLSQRGYAWMSPDTVRAFYTRMGENSTRFEAIANLPEDEREKMLMKDLMQFDRDLKDFNLVLRDVVNTPLVKADLVGKPAAVSMSVILSPLVFSPVVLSPSVLGPLILSPVLFSPLILSPRVLGPFILSPGVGNPIILSPFVLSPVILSPQVLFPVVLSPLVLSPIILSPLVVGTLILSPLVLSPIILSPLVVFAIVLSPCVLSPLIQSPLSVVALVLSPFAGC